MHPAHRGCQWRWGGQVHTGRYLACPALLPEACLLGMEGGSLPTRKLSQGSGANHPEVGSPGDKPQPKGHRTPWINASTCCLWSGNSEGILHANLQGPQQEGTPPPTAAGSSAACSSLPSPLPSFAPSPHPHSKYTVCTQVLQAVSAFRGIQIKADDL